MFLPNFRVHRERSSKLTHGQFNLLPLDEQLELMKEHFPPADHDRQEEFIGALVTVTNKQFNIDTSRGLLRDVIDICDRYADGCPRGK